MKSDPAFGEQLLQHHAGTKDTAVPQRSAQSVIPYLPTMFIIDRQAWRTHACSPAAGCPS